MMYGVFYFIHYFRTPKRNSFLSHKKILYLNVKWPIIVSDDENIHCPKTEQSTYASRAALASASAEADTEYL